MSYFQIQAVETSRTMAIYSSATVATPAAALEHAAATDRLPMPEGQSSRRAFSKGLRAAWESVGEACGYRVITLSDTAGEIVAQEFTERAAAERRDWPTDAGMSPSDAAALE